MRVILCALCWSQLAAVPVVINKRASVREEKEDVDEKRSERETVESALASAEQLEAFLDSGSLSGFLSLDEVTRLVDGWAAKHSDILRKEVVGKSVEGRSLNTYQLR